MHDDKAQLNQLVRNSHFGCCSSRVMIFGSIMNSSYVSKVLQAGDVLIPSLSLEFLKPWPVTAPGDLPWSCHERWGGAQGPFQPG